MVADLQQILRSFSEPVAELATRLALTLLSVRPDLEAKARLGWGSVNYRHPRGRLRLRASSRWRITSRWCSSTAAN